MLRIHPNQRWFLAPRFALVLVIVVIAAWHLASAVQAEATPILNASLTCETKKNHSLLCRAQDPDRIFEILIINARTGGIEQEIIGHSAESIQFILPNDTEDSFDRLIRLTDESRPPVHEWFRVTAVGDITGPGFIPPERPTADDFDVPCDGTAATIVNNPASPPPPGPPNQPLTVTFKNSGDCDCIIFVFGKRDDRVRKGDVFVTKVLPGEKLERRCLLLNGKRCKGTVTVK